MEKRFVQRKAGKVLAAATAAAGLAGFGAAQADAALIVDVRATHLNGAPIGGLDTAKLVAVNNGDVVTMGVFAQVTGTDAVANESLQILGGSFKSSVGGLLGNLSSVTDAPFNGLGSTNGNQADFDSDGDLDVGSTGTTAANKFAGRSAAPTDVPASGEVRVGTLTFTATDINAGPNTFVNFVPRQGTSSGVALWWEDGSETGTTPGTGTFAANGLGVEIVPIPEPASVALLGLASIGLLARRRNA